MQEREPWLDRIAFYLSEPVRMAFFLADDLPTIVREDGFSFELVRDVVRYRRWREWRGS